MRTDGQEQVGQRRVLILRGPQDDAFWTRLLEQHCDVRFCDSVEEAQRLMGQASFDAVITQRNDLLPLQEVTATQHAFDILNTLGEGVCIVSPEGQITWANHRMQSFIDLVREPVRQRCQAAFDYFSRRHPVGDGDMPSRRYSFTCADLDRYFEMICTPMGGGSDAFAQMAVVVWEETASRRLQRRIDAIDKAGRELVRLEAESFGGMSVSQRIDLLQSKIIRYAKDLLKFDHFVVRVLNRQTNELEVLFGVGLPGDEDQQVFASINNNGISGYVAATGRSYICNDPARDPRYLPGLDAAACSLTVPLRLHDKIIGTLNVESRRERAFSEDDRQVAEIFGRYVAVALNILDLLVVERYQTTGEAADVLGQNVSEPVSRIITEASMLMEEYIGHDDMRRRLQQVINEATAIKQAVRDLQDGPKGVFSGKTPQKVDAELGGKRLLVVDDEQFIRETISDVVEKYGCQAEMARDGREALTLLKQRQYDLVISDIKLPHATGYEIFAAAREVNRDVPVILMTGFGYDPNHSIVRANMEGLSAVLYKPFKVDQLMTEIRQALKADEAQDR